MRWVMRLGNGDVAARGGGWVARVKTEQGELESMLQLRATDLRSQYRIHPRGALGSFTVCNGNGTAQQCEKHGRSSHYEDEEKRC